MKALKRTGLLLITVLLLPAISSEGARFATEDYNNTYIWIDPNGDVRNTDKIERDVNDYTFIDDIIAGILSALDAEFDFEIFNLGGGHSITLTELIEFLGEKLGKRPVLKRLPFQPGDVMATLADVGKATEMLGYRPETSPAEGIESFIDWFRREREGGR